jgi:uncharacterized membrane protein
MSPAGLAKVFAALAAFVLGIGAAFAAAGAWLVAPFAGLEVLLLAGAYFAYARRAADYERIEIDRERLTVEVGEAGRTVRYEMEAGAARLYMEKERVVLRGAHRELEIGRHLDAERRAELAAELGTRLIRGRGT